MLGGFRYKPREDWFSFAKVKKLCFLCSCISQRHAHDAYVLRHPPECLPLTTVSGSEKKVFITLEIWIFILQKWMDSLQEAFIHPLEPCEGRFIMDAHALFNVFRSVYSKHPFIPMERLGRARTIFF